MGWRATMARPCGREAWASQRCSPVTMAVNQAEAEANHYGLHRSLNFDPHFVVVHARRNHGIGKSYVTTTLNEWLRQIR